jgi:hypothetical protein
MKYSDLIIPRGKENSIAIDFISENLKNRLKVFPQKAVEEAKVEVVSSEVSVLIAKEEPLLKEILQKIISD